MDIIPKYPVFIPEMIENTDDFPLNIMAEQFSKGLTSNTKIIIIMIINIIIIIQLIYIIKRYMLSSPMNNDL